MKYYSKLIKTYLLVLVVFFSYLTLAQTISYTAGTSNDYKLPAYGLYDYSVTGIILLQSEIGSGTKTLTNLQFEVAGYTTTYTYTGQDIYFAHISESTFDSSPAIDLSDLTVSDLTKVVDAQSVSISSNGWQTITLDTEFEYNGVDNLVVLWENRDGSWSSGYGYAESSSSYTNRGFYKYQDGSFPTGNGTRTNIIYNIKMDYTAGPSISYASSTYCSADADPSPTLTGNAGAGSYSSSAGLSINSSTGVIDVSASTVGSYTVTYTDTDLQTATFDVTIESTCQLLITDADFTGCAAVIKDNGGDSNYGTNRNDEIILTPSSGNGKLVFSSFSTESCCDELEIYQDNGAGWDLIDTYAGSTSPGTIVSTGTLGKLKLIFTSDGSVQYSGFEATFSCTTPPANDACADAIELTIDAAAISCDFSDATSSGGDYQYGEKPDIWYKFTTTCAGDYGITSTNSSYDVDLYVYENCSDTFDLATWTLETSANNESGSVELAANTTYYIRANDWDVGYSTFDLAVTLDAVSSPTWTGATSSAWTTASNWCGDFVPTSSDTPTIPNVGFHPEISTAVTIAGLTVDAGVDITISSNSLTVTGAYDLNGTMNIDNATVNADGTFDATGGTVDFTNAAGKLVLSSTVTALGALDEAMGTVEYDGASQSVLGDTYNNLTISSAGTKTAAGAITVNGNLNTAATATCKLDMGANNLNLAGDLTVGATDGLDLSDASCILTFVGSSDQTVTHAGNSGGTYTHTLLDEDFESEATGNVSSSFSETIMYQAGNQCGSDIWDIVTTTQSASIKCTGCTGKWAEMYYDACNQDDYLYTTVFSGETTNLDISFDWKFDYYSLGGADGFYVYLYNETDNTNVSTLISQSGADGGGTYSGTVSLTGSNSVSDSYRIKFRYTGNDDWGCSVDNVLVTEERPLAGSEVTKLVIDKSGGAVVLNDEISVDGTITFISGDIEATSNNLVLTANAIVSGADDDSHVIGSVVKTTTSTSQFTFPVGDGSNYRPIAITPYSSDETIWTANYQAEAYSSLAVDVPLQVVSDVEYWNLNRSGTADGAVTLWWNENSTVNTSDLSELRVAHFNSGNSLWEDAGNTSTSGTASSGSITSSVDWSTYSPFTIGATEGTALPITYLGMEGRCTENGSVILNWRTASELNNSHFEIDTSLDGLNWSSLASVNAVGNSSSTSTYTYEDLSATKHFQGYYRLRQLDIDGDATIFPPIAVFCNEITNSASIELYPNPANEVVNVYIEQHYETHAYLSVVDMFGKVVYDDLIHLNTGSITLPVNVHYLPKGVYIVSVVDTQHELRKRLVVN